jgi:hypothetical protein
MLRKISPAKKPGFSGEGASEKRGVAATNKRTA